MGVCTVEVFASISEVSTSIAGAVSTPMGKVSTSIASETSTPIGEASTSMGKVSTFMDEKPSKGLLISLALQFFGSFESIGSVILLTLCQ